MKHLCLFVLFLLAGCTSIPEKVTPINGFDANRYLGTWYEIARLDHSFERGLEQITATYSLRSDGGIKVINKGFNTELNEWNEAEGKAYFVDDRTIGHLKVSFFGPFYGSYIIFGLDKDNYQYAFVSGPNTDYLWLLSRTPTVSDTTLKKFKTTAKDSGFDTSKLIYVTH